LLYWGGVFNSSPTARHAYQDAVKRPCPWVITCELPNSDNLGFKRDPLVRHIRNG
jgi:hypothetical protein